MGNRKSRWLVPSDEEDHSAPTHTSGHPIGLLLVFFYVTPHNPVFSLCFSLGVFLSLGRLNSKG